MKPLWEGIVRFEGDLFRLSFGKHDTFFGLLIYQKHSDDWCEYYRFKFPDLDKYYGNVFTVPDYGNLYSDWDVIQKLLIREGNRRKEPPIIVYRVLAILAQYMSMEYLFWYEQLTQKPNA